MTLMEYSRRIDDISVYLMGVVNGRTKSPFPPYIDVKYDPYDNEFNFLKMDENGVFDTKKPFEVLARNKTEQHMNTQKFVNDLYEFLFE